MAGFAKRVASASLSATKMWRCTPIAAPPGKSGLGLAGLPRFAKPAMERHLAHLNWLRAKHGVTGPVSRFNVPRGETFEDCVADGSVIAGTPAQVTAEIERQTAELGANYLLTYLFLGTMSLAEALRSLALFSTEVMPKIARL